MMIRPKSWQEPVGANSRLEPEPVAQVTQEVEDRRLREAIHILEGGVSFPLNTSNRPDHSQDDVDPDYDDGGVEAARRALEEEEALLDSECPPEPEPAPEAAPEPTPVGETGWWERLAGNAG
jgi:hypothetical protein